MSKSDKSRLRQIRYKNDRSRGGSSRIVECDGEH